MNRNYVYEDDCKERKQPKPQFEDRASETPYQIYIAKTRKKLFMKE